MRRRGQPVRPWYAGRQPPPPEVVSIFDDAGKPEVLYSQADSGAIDGEFAAAMRGLYGKMDTLKRSPNEFRTWTEEDGYVTFYLAMLDIAAADIRARLQVLQALGGFKFRSIAGPEEKKSLIEAVFAPPQQDEDPRIVSSSRARRLSQIWSPLKDSALDFIISRPAQAGRLLSDRLNPTNKTPLRLIGHPFHNVRSTALKPVADARLIAFERDGEINIVPGVHKTLLQWDADAAAVGGVGLVSLMETLLLHELVELVMHELQPEVPPLCSHVVATTFERYLKADLLSVAVEDFFLDWPPLSEEEQAERMELELKQELREARAMFAEEKAPADVDDDVGNLPVDPSGQPGKGAKKKTGVKKKVKKKKQG